MALWTAACGTASPEQAQPGQAAVPAGPGGVPVPAGAQAAVVVRQVDGDTVVLRGLGSGPLPGGSTKVRLVGVDTPEVFASPRTPDVPQCYGQKASARTAALLPLGARVRVAADRECEDRYGRALLYVWTGRGVLVEQDLLRGGYGRVLVISPNDRYAATLRADERAARAARRGLWSACP